MEDTLCTPKRGTCPSDDGNFIIPPTPNLNLLGYGTGVNVWSFDKTANSSPWAVKNVRKFLKLSDQRCLQQRLDNEASVLSEIEHDHIIGFRGVLESVDGRRCLAMEACGRSLGDMVEERMETGEKFTIKEITTVIRCIASALNYLHTEKKLLHGDLKSFNVLIKDNFKVVKLCDFGVCEHLNDDGIAKEYHGTLIYNAPEVLNENTEPITAKAEIFSLGLLLWEMLALQMPFTSNLDDSVIPLDDSVESELSFMDNLSASCGVRLPPPPGLDQTYNKLLEIYNACTEPKPHDRPSAARVITMLDEIRLVD